MRQASVYRVVIHHWDDSEEDEDDQSTGKRKATGTPDISSNATTKLKTTGTQEANKMKDSDHEEGKKLWEEVCDGCLTSGEKKKLVAYVQHRAQRGEETEKPAIRKLKEFMARKETTSQKLQENNTGSHANIAINQSNTSN